MFYVIKSQIYHIYIQHFSDIQKKNVPFKWEEMHQVVFELIKEQMHKLPVLFHPDLSKTRGRF